LVGLNDLREQFEITGVQLLFLLDVIWSSHSLWLAHGLPKCMFVWALVMFISCRSLMIEQNLIPLQYFGFHSSIAYNSHK
jgi:hypothetical protein